VRLRGVWYLPAAAVEARAPRRAIEAALVRRPTDFFECPKGGALLYARICVARQQLAERQVPAPGKDAKHHKGNAMRGVAPRFVFCRSTTCADGKRIRMVLGELKADPVLRRGYTIRPDGWDRLPPAQAAAAARLARVGLLDQVPTIDVEPAAEAAAG
jgi:hypothetical protein